MNVRMKFHVPAHHRYSDLGEFGSMFQLQAECWRASHGTASITKDFIQFFDHAARR